MSVLELVPAAPSHRAVSWDGEAPSYSRRSPAQQQRLDNWRARLARLIGETALEFDEAQITRCENAISDARTMSALARELWAETLAYQIADDDELDADTLAIRWAMYLPVAHGVAYVMRDRARLIADGKLAERRPSRQYDALRTLIEEIKAQVTIVDLIERETPVWPLLTGSRESHAPCLLCGGRDRFVIPHVIPSWAWCRRCEWAPDVVGYAAAAWGLDPKQGDQLREIATRLGRDYLGLASEAA